MFSGVGFSVRLLRARRVVHVRAASQEIAGVGFFFPPPLCRGSECLLLFRFRVGRSDVIRTSASKCHKDTVAADSPRRRIGRAAPRCLARNF